MIKRLLRSMKYECVYLNAFETGSELRSGISVWLNYCNAKRQNSIHGLLTPSKAYASKSKLIK